MKWQEYQEAVGELYERLDDLGVVHRSVTIPDKVTGQPRQIDVLVEVEAYGHTLRIIVDAKFHAKKIDVRDVEEVLALSKAVGGSTTVIVTANGWTEPAAKRAEFEDCALRIFSLEDALDLMVPDKWSMCPNCKSDCIVLDLDGATEYESAWLWWLAGRCRECKHGFLWCQECGSKIELPYNYEVFCYCGHGWLSNDAGIAVRFEVVESGT